LQISRNHNSQELLVLALIQINFLRDLRHGLGRGYPRGYNVRHQRKADTDSMTAFWRKADISNFRIRQANFRFH
jgi:hypothetical protein